MIDLNDDLVKILGMPTIICLQIAQSLELAGHIIGPTTLHKTAFVKAWFLNMYEIYPETWEKEAEYSIKQGQLEKPRIVVPG